MSSTTPEIVLPRSGLESGRQLTVLQGTKMINLTAAKGNPIEAMDFGLSLQAASLGTIASGKAEFTGGKPVPDLINQSLAASLVDILRSYNDRVTR